MQEKFQTFLAQKGTKPLSNEDLERIHRKLRRSPQSPQLCVSHSWLNAESARRLSNRLGAPVSGSVKATDLARSCRGRE